MVSMAMLFSMRHEKSPEFTAFSRKEKEIYECQSSVVNNVKV